MTLSMQHGESWTCAFSEPFHIARTEESEAIRTVAVDLDLDGAHGLGECYPLAYYGETAETVTAVLPRLLGALDGARPAARRPRAPCWPGWNAPPFLMTDVLGNHGAAKAGLDIALHDLAGKALGVPVWELLGTSDRLPPTDYSLGIDEPAVVAERARRASHFPALKIKVGGPADIETLEAVRGVYGGPLRVDANTGWQPEQAAALIPELARLGVELIEQPFPARALPQLRWLRERSSLPILADESAVFEDDLPMLAGRRGRRRRQARQVRRHRPGSAHDPAGAAAGHEASCSAAWSSRASAWRPGPWSPPRSTGWTSTAT